MALPQLKTAEEARARHDEWLAAGWKIAGERPEPGQRVHVRHLVGTQGIDSTLAPATGEFGADGWSCSEFFIDPYTMRMFEAPTHWRPITREEQAA